MNDMLQRAPLLRMRRLEFSYEERAQLNAIIDLLIPADENFPPPSSLHLLDEFLHYLLPHTANESRLMLNETRLRSVLRDLNASAGGSFCKASVEKQQALLRRLERSDPAFFQELWTLANHSYYTQLAIRRHPMHPSKIQASSITT